MTVSAVVPASEWRTLWMDCNHRKRLYIAGYLLIKLLIAEKSAIPITRKYLKRWSRRGDSNPGPADYESAALPLSYAGKMSVWPYSTRV